MAKKNAYKVEVYMNGKWKTFDIVNNERAAKKLLAAFDECDVPACYSPVDKN